MQTLLKNTDAYKLLLTEKEENRLNHAYLIVMDDARSLRSVLTEFALVFFTQETENDGGRYARIENLIRKESFSDCLFFPKSDKKFAVSDVDEIKEESALNPVEGDKKLFVIGDFAELGVAQQNKLLKLLEEPPEKVYFLLGATTSYPILQTVLSRVKKLEITPFSEKEIQDFLLRNYDTENMDKEKITFYGATANGWVGNAQNALEESYFDELCMDSFSLCLKEKAIPILAKKLGESKYKKELISFLRLIFRDATFIKSGIGKDSLLLRSQIEKVKKVADRYELSALIYAQTVFTEAEKQVKFNTNFAQCIELCFEKIENKNFIKGS